MYLEGLMMDRKLGGKKGQGRTFWIVVTAIISLVVLVIVMLIFTGKIRILEEGLVDCETKLGICQPCTNENCLGEKCSDGIKQSFECPENHVCCLGGGD